ncbi:MAG: hypothetical protein H6810_03730 [Phycisphaeraceae bacterium]|nr:MAG: hypothetical protein H6810_03730 [Phycisphaeraceae bacterium]
MQSTIQTDQFDNALDHAFQGIRGALTDLLVSVKADPTKPQEIARRFKINKNLAWKVSKIITVTDPHAVISNLPGTAGMDTILSAFEAAGAPEPHLTAAREAFGSFDRMVEVHVGDRSTLQLVLSSKAPRRVPPEHLHQTRKMAFQGNSCIWGIQSRVRLASFFLAPNPNDPAMLDTASLSGMIDVRRLRSNASVPLLVRFAYNDDGSIRQAPPVDSIDPASADDPLHLMPEFCSDPLPEFVPVEGAGFMRYQLAPGPIGNYGLNTWVYGEFTRRFASIYRDEHNLYGEHAAIVQTPTEWMICDLQVHKSLAFAMTPRAVQYAQHTPSPQPAGSDEYDRLPMAERIEPIGQCPPVTATPLLPDYPDMVRRVYDRLGWDATDFHGFRLTMKYPPMNTYVIIQHDLAEPK